MNNNAKMASVAAGAVVGIAAIYSYKRGYSFDLIIEKFEENKERFYNFVESLIKLGFELLEKLATFIQRIVKELMFKFKLKTNEMIG